MRPAGPAQAGGGATTVADRWAVAVTVAMALLSIAGGASGAAGAPGPVRGGPILSVAGCGPFLPGGEISGDLEIDGGPLTAAALAGVEVHYNYHVGFVTVQNPGGTVFSAGCAAESGNGTTSSGGTFSFVPATPAPSCEPDNGDELCTNYSAAHEPVQVSLAEPPPAGYVVSIEGPPTAIVVALVYQLVNVTLAPSGPTLTTSDNAPTAVTATAWAGNGTLSEEAVSFAWAVQGSGWTISGPTEGGSVAVVGILGSSVGELTVTAVLAVNGTVLSDLQRTVALIAVPTEIETGAANRTELDVGGSVEFAVTALGAEGFAYRATFTAGLGLPAPQVPCTSDPSGSGTVIVDCSVNVTYPEPGAALPSANVSNGYSFATWQFNAVVVDPPPELEVLPAAPVGYVDSPIELTATTENGSGTAPFLRACLAAASLAPMCESSPGPTWTFSPVFAAPGDYPAKVSATDADGINASTPLSFAVVAPLAIGPVEPTDPNVSAGGSVELRATVSGGVTPLAYWWNASGVAGSLLHAEIAQDGNLTLSFVPNASGRWVLTVTVVDRLGSAVASEAVLSVGPPSAARVVPVRGPAAVPVTAGVPVALAWSAYGLSGSIDPSFAVAAELDLTATVGLPLAWLNASGLGALSAIGNGVFGVPASAWVGGTLSVNLTVRTSATVTVSLTGTALPGPVAPVNVTVEPDSDHVRLFDPTVVEVGTRANATLWHIADRFGNAVPGALLTIESSFGADRQAVVVTAFTLPAGASGVWINYSAPTPGSGEVTVVDGAGAVVLGPLAVPPAPAPTLAPAEGATLVAVPVGAAGAATLALVRRRRRGRATGGEEELRILAEGRARTVELIGQAGATDLAGLERAWGTTPPPALADWLASLVADGTVRGTVGEDGRPRFCLTQRPVDHPTVTVDPDVLDRSLRERAAALTDPDDGPPPD